MQVVSNLVSNAIKFVAPEVQPRTRVWVEPMDNSIIRLWVEDNGIGIDPAARRRIFRAFERLHGIESYPGTGVGLAIVERASEQLGGACGIEPRPGGGSRFWVNLQAAGT